MNSRFPLAAGAARAPRPARFYLRSLAAVTGANTYSQTRMLEDFRARIGAMPGAEPVLEKITAIYDNSDVDARHLEIPIEEIDRRRETQGWHPIARDAILSLAERALTSALSANTRADECDAVVVVASNFDGFPGPARRLVQSLGLRTDTLFFDLASLACGGANHGIQLAQMLLETGRCRTVAVVCVDVLNTHIQARRYPKLPSVSEIVARVLPSDGAAAMILGIEPGPRAVLSYASATMQVRSWPDSIAFAFAGTADDGEPFGSVGKDIRARFVDDSAPLFNPDVVANPIFIHGGGTALLQHLAQRMPELEAPARFSAAVLRDNGNMSAANVLHVFARGLRERLPIEPRFHLLAFGPGFYTTMLRFDEVEAGTVTT